MQCPLSGQTEQRKVAKAYGSKGRRRQRRERKDRYYSGNFILHFFDEPEKSSILELVNTGKFLGFLLLLDFLRSLSQSVYHSPPTPLPYDADPRYFRFVKGSSHSGEESEPLRGDTEMSSEALGDGGAKWSKSDSEDGSKEVYTKGSSTFTKSKTMPGIEVYYADSDDEDICPTCLDDYTLENPKIITKCSHHFHLSCIYEWMERSETCPVCGKVMAFDENETS
ncbi:unnamed protein product [Arabidopsis thaliana]|uniref:RING-type E3 ubiquitin transferase n=1 Tax=Arabidopsis thaliana TaxID=3702 RepID=Q9FMB2_ARATH|nr:unnamed protein product [Arabidopsis thaliana]